MFVLFRASTNLDLVGCNESEACNHNEMNNFCSKFPIPYHSWLNPIAAQQGSILSLSFYKTDSAITIFLEILQVSFFHFIIYICLSSINCPYIPKPITFLLASASGNFSKQSECIRTNWRFEIKNCRLHGDCYSSKDSKQTVIHLQSLSFTKLVTNNIRTCLLMDSFADNQ